MRIKGSVVCNDGDQRYECGTIKWCDLDKWLDEPLVFQQIADYCKDAVKQGTVEKIAAEFAEKGVYVELPL